MHGQRLLLRASVAPTFCSSCARRVYGKGVPELLPPQGRGRSACRRLNSTQAARWESQSRESAPFTSGSDGFHGAAGAYTGLTAAEQREKEHRRRIREESAAQQQPETLHGTEAPGHTALNGDEAVRGGRPAAGRSRSMPMFQTGAARQAGSREDSTVSRTPNNLPESQPKAASRVEMPNFTSESHSQKINPAFNNGWAANSGERTLQKPTGVSMEASHAQETLQMRPGSSGHETRILRSHPRTEFSMRAGRVPQSGNVDDEGPQRSWKNLRQSDSNRNSLDSTASRYGGGNRSAPKARSPFDDLETIERQFQQHRAQRRPRFNESTKASLEPNPNIVTMDRKDMFHHNDPFAGRTPRVQPSTMRCARCLEEGHRASQCTGPNRSTCKRCGVVGHFADACPQRGEDMGTVNIRRTEPDRPTHSAQDTSYRPFDAVTQPESRAEALRWPVKESRTESEDTAPQRRGRASFWASDEAAEEEGQLSRRRSKKSRNSRRASNIEEDEEGEEIREAKAARKAARKAEREQKAKEALMGRLDAKGTKISLPEFISVSNLAQTLGIRYEAFVARLARFGYDDVFAGKILNAETSGMIAMEYNFDPVFESSPQVALEAEEEHNLKALPEAEDKSILPSRPPVVTIMGHVDHGKTTILDYLRQSSIAAGEAGGITQHIGAFSVPLTASGKTITFLDTPGHAAFLAMRQRGANVTDIVILVVAADDSVKPQTLEALRHARGANVPIIVAVNKIDKPEANLEQVKNDLARHGIEIEDFGGDTQVIPVSGKTGKGISDLEEAILTLSEVLDHRAAPDGVVEGWVLEGTTKLSGRVATILVRRGTLRPGTIIVAGKTWARVRTLRNESGQVVEEVGPGMPVEVDGWRDQPVAGDEVLQAASEQKATSVVEFRELKDQREKAAKDIESINEARRLDLERRSKPTEEDGETTGSRDSQTSYDNESKTASGQMMVPFIIKADVSGSAEAVAAYVQSVSSPLITPQILSAQVGKVHESDVELASTTKAHIIAFNLPEDENMKGLAESKGVRILANNIIYRTVEDVRALLEEKLPPVITQRVLGEAEIAAEFNIGIGGRKKMKIAGCKIRNGVIGKGARVRVVRDGAKVYDGSITSLKNVKKEVQEMRKGTECGMGFSDWESFEVGDQIQTYEEVSEKRKLHA